MNQNQVLLTPEGLDELKKELLGLETKRPQLIKRLDEARSLGDLSENEAYKAARREQAFLDGRIIELKDLLKRAKLAPKNNGGKVGIGSKVKVKIDSEKQEFILVDESEANLANGKLSHSSPIGAALLGKKVGDQIEVKAPIGKVVYTILEIN